MAIETAAGIGISVLVGEHLFSTLLSSPWTVEKFAETEQDKAKVRRLYWTAVAITGFFSLMMAILLKQIWPLVFAFFLCIFYIIIYERAMGKGI